MQHIAIALGSRESQVCIREELDRPSLFVVLLTEKMMRVEPVGNCVLGTFPRDPRAVARVVQIQPD